MPMLTRSEVREQFGQSANVHPREFFKELADYMPQGVPDEWMDEMRAHFCDTWGEEAGDLMATAYMMGLHGGWYLRKRVKG